jgi:hypothetical protein
MVDSVQKLRPVDLVQRVDHVRGFDGVGPVGRIGGIVRLVPLSRDGDVVAVSRLVPDPVVGAVRPVGPVRTVVADAGHGARVSGPGPRWHCPAPSGADARRGRYRCRSRRSRLVRPRPTSSSAFDRIAGLVAYFECVESYVNRRKSLLEVDVTVERDKLVRMQVTSGFPYWEGSTGEWELSYAMRSEAGTGVSGVRAVPTSEVGGLNGLDHSVPGSEGRTLRSGPATRRSGCARSVSSPGRTPGTVRPTRVRVHTPSGWRPATGSRNRGSVRQLS